MPQITSEITTENFDKFDEQSEPKDDRKYL